MENALIDDGWRLQMFVLVLYDFLAKQGQDDEAFALKLALHTIAEFKKSFANPHDWLLAINNFTSGEVQNQSFWS